MNTVQRLYFNETCIKTIYSFDLGGQTYYIDQHNRENPYSVSNHEIVLKWFDDLEAALVYVINIASQSIDRLLSIS